MKVEFDIDVFRCRYEHLADISDEALKMCFQDACELYGNDDSSLCFKYEPENDIYARRAFLYAVTCHLATLELWNKNGQPGRVISASQGSVNTSFDLFKSNKDTADWWNQTLCGQHAWQMLKGRTKGGRFYGYKINHPFG